MSEIHKNMSELDKTKLFRQGKIMFSIEVTRKTSCRPTQSNRSRSPPSLQPNLDEIRRGRVSSRGAKPRHAKVRAGSVADGRLQSGGPPDADLPGISPSVNCPPEKSPTHPKNRPPTLSERPRSLMLSSASKLRRNFAAPLDACGRNLRPADAPSAARATNYYWDLNGAGAGSGGVWNGGPGPNYGNTGNTWLNGTLNWNTDAGGTAIVAPVTTTSNDDLYFFAGSDYTAGVNVNVSGPQSAAGLIFQSPPNLAVLSFSSANNNNGINQIIQVSGSNGANISLDGDGITSINNAATVFLTSSVGSLSPPIKHGPIIPSIRFTSPVERPSIGALSIAGTGTIVLGGNNSGNGGITIDSGTLQAGGAVGGNNVAATTSVFGAGTIVIGDGMSANNATLQVYSSGLTFTNPITVAAGGSGTYTIGVTNGATATFAGNITLDNNLALNSNTGSSTGELIVSGAITGSGNINVVGASAPVRPNLNPFIVVLSGSNTGFTGNVSVASGSYLQTGSGSALGLLAQ